MIRGGTATVSPSSPATLTPPPGAVTGVQILNSSYYLLEVDAGADALTLCGALNAAAVNLPAQGQSVTLTVISGSGGPGSVAVYWLQAGDAPTSGSLGPNPAAYVSLGTIASGQTSATFTPPPGTTALVINGVASTATVTAKGASSGVALPVGTVGGQWVASLPGGPADTAYTVTLSATQATAANVWSTANQAVVLNLPASATSGGAATDLVDPVSYNPTSTTTFPLALTNLTLISSALQITFTAPASGNVVVTFEALYSGTSASGSSANIGYVLDGGVVTSSSRFVYYWGATGNAPGVRLVVALVITGLSAGSHTVGIAGFCTVAAGDVSILCGGTTGAPYGPAIIRVQGEP